MSVIHYIPFALAPDADRYASNPTTDRIRVPGSGVLQFLLVEGAGGTGYGTITANAFAAASGGSGTALAFRYKVATSSAELNSAGGWTTAPTTGVEVAAGANKSVLIEFRHDEVTNTKPFVCLTMTETDSTAVDAAIIALVVDGDRPGDSNTTYIA